MNVELWASEVLAGAAGLVIGSFLNVCIYRLPQDLSLYWPPRSFCPACHRTIPAWENIPLLSWLWLRGQCAGCGSRIPLRYPLVELLTGTLFVLAVLLHGWTAEAIRLQLYASILLVLLFTDLETRILPDECTLGGASAGWLFALLMPQDPGLVGLCLPGGATPAGRSLAGSLLGGLLPAAGLRLIGALYQMIRRREGLGLGDVKMLLMVGAFAGLESTLLIVMAASLLGSLTGLVLVARRGAAATLYELPFGSFLAAAALALAYGPPLVRLYWGLDPVTP